MYFVKIKREEDAQSLTNRPSSKRRWFAYGENKQTGEKFVRGYRTLAEAKKSNEQHTIIEIARKGSIMRSNLYE